MQANTRDNYTKVRGLLSQLEEFRSAPTKENWLSDTVDLSKLKYGQEIVQELGPFEKVEFKDHEYEEDVDVWSVYFFQDYEVYIKFEGSYTSYEGVNCTKVSHVEPALVTVTQYQPVK